MKTIVAAVDFSDASEEVISKATEMARIFSGELRLVHVIEPQPSYSTYGFTTEEFPVIQDFQRQAQDLAQKRLEEMRDALREDGIDATSQLSVGSTTHEIASILETLEDSMLVVGTHGHNLVGSILLGSVAESLVRKAVVPTLVVPVS